MYIGFPDWNELVVDFEEVSIYAISFKFKEEAPPQPSPKGRE
jgi:hypothetical protein